MRALTCLANRFSTVQITVQYHCIFVLLFGWYSLQLDNNSTYYVMFGLFDYFTGEHTTVRGQDQ